MAASVRRRVVGLVTAALMVVTIMAVAFASPAQAQQLTGTCGVSGSDVFCTVGDYSLACSTPPTGGGTVTCENLNNLEQTFSCVLTPTEQGRFAATCTALFEEPPPECTMTGTDGRDALLGTSANDVICALGGDDNVSGGAGNDTLSGGAGNDNLSGDGGNDEIDAREPQGTTGTDRVSGGEGDDTIDARDGQVDYVSCGGGTDTVYFDQGIDRVSPDCEIRNPEDPVGQ